MQRKRGGLTGFSQLVTDKPTRPMLRNRHGVFLYTSSIIVCLQTKTPNKLGRFCLAERGGGDEYKKMEWMKRNQPIDHDHMKRIIHAMKNLGVVKIEDSPPYPDTQNL